MSKVIAIIPARSGSKGVPHKNIRTLGGIPLFMWSINCAVKSKTDIVVFNSDSEEYLDLCTSEDIIKILRPSELAADYSLTAEVILHTLERLSANADDIIILLQPTCPFRTSKQVDFAVDVLRTNIDDAVISVTRVDANHPLRMKRIVNGVLVNYIDTGYEDMRPRQALPDVYIRSGSIYACSVGNFRRHKNFWGLKVIPIIENNQSSINIDTEEDFLLAEYYLAK
jgi:CMP-N,N'-diacetyllegionaminic acid synthase